MRSRESSAKMETPFRLRGPVACSVRRTVVDSEGFSQAGLNTSGVMKRKPVRPHTEGHTRNTHAVWLVSDASDRLDVDVDEPVDPDGLGGERTDSVSTECVLAAPRTPTKAEREEHDVSNVPYRPWCRFCVMGRGLEKRHLTQSGDCDDDRTRVFADDGYLIGESTPLFVAKDRRIGMTFAAPVSMKGGGDPHAARLLAWSAKKSPSKQTESQVCELIRRVRELRAEGTTTVDEVSPPGDSAGNGIAERPS